MVSLFFCIAACNQKEMGGENDKNEIELNINNFIELNINNFTDFFTYTKGQKYDAGAYRIAYTIEGVLDFAYYEDVVITFEVIYQNSENEEKTTYMTHTNAAGDVSFLETDATKSLGIAAYHKIINFEVKSVSGVVHFY